MVDDDCRRRPSTSVIAGLDPAIHHLAKKMDPRVKPDPYKAPSGGAGLGHGRVCPVPRTRYLKLVS
jgi:hypothetical protein